MFDFWGEVAFLKKAALSVNIRAASDLLLIHRSVLCFREVLIKCTVVMIILGAV